MTHGHALRTPPPRAAILLLAPSRGARDAPNVSCAEPELRMHLKLGLPLLALLWVGSNWVDGAQAELLLRVGAMGVALWTAFSLPIPRRPPPAADDDEDWDEPWPRSPEAGPDEAGPDGAAPGGRPRGSRTPGRRPPHGRSD